jgi:hypothetical protein
MRINYAIISATSGTSGGQQWLKSPAGCGFKTPNWSRPIRLWQPRKLPGLGSAAIAAGNGVGDAFDALPQLAAQAEGSGGAKGRQGGRDRGSGLGPGDRGSRSKIAHMCGCNLVTWIG